MEVMRFALLGLATGAIYGLLAQGLVVVYRGSGILNFAQGAVAMFGAYAYFELAVKQRWATVPAVVVALLLSGALGALIHMVILRPMQRASALSRVIATLGVVLVIQSAAYLRYGHVPDPVPSPFPTRHVRLFSSSLNIGEDRIYIFTVCVVLSVVLFIAYRWTPLGRLTTAVAERELVAATVGHSPNLIAVANWIVGSILAGIAGILIAPILYLEPTALVLLVIPAMAAALMSEFKSFPITLTAALALGVAQSELQRYVDAPGWPTAAPFVAVIVVLVIRGRHLPLRSFVLERLPTVGSGRVRWQVVVCLGGVACWLTMVVGADWSRAIATTAAVAIICLSVVVLTGYAGQLSLTQYVLAGVGALSAARLAPHVPFLIAIIAAAVITAIVGGVLGLAALRSRGATLAVATLCLASAAAAVILQNSDLNGVASPAAGLVVPSPTVLGWSIDPIVRSNRYGLTVIVVLIVVSVAVGNLRRGASGRRMLAVRSNERAAAALGLNVGLVKLYAFMVAAGIAAIGGVLLAFIFPVVDSSKFNVFTCLLIVAVAVVGGVGNIPGAYIGALLVSGGITTQLFSKVHYVGDYLPLVGGLALIATLVLSPDGIFETNRHAIKRLLALRLTLRFIRADARRSAVRLTPSSATAVRVTSLSLRVSDLSVSFGGVKALNDVCLDILPGEVHGLIGPNGAGKTTLIDAVTGLVRTSGGCVELGALDISAWSPRRRARQGLSRSFQSLELFTDLTIAENIAIAEDTFSWRPYVTDFVKPGRVKLGFTASEALRHLELDGLIDRRPSEISFGQRKTVAIARSIASSPSILLLDEPAAGLDDYAAAELATLIRQLADEWGIAVLLVEHKVDMVMSISDRVTVLNNGSVLASGTPAHVRNHPDVIDAYLGSSQDSPVAQKVVA